MSSKRHHRESGVILVQVALFVIGALALAALVVDMGLAVLTQQQMQDSTEFVALEGLRWRDELGDAGRRDLAQQSATWCFDDNFDPGDGDAYQRSLGPNFQLVNPLPQAPQLAAGATIDTTTIPYRPELDTNVGNALSGDLVAGNFDLVDTLHEEFSDYTRTDFSVDPLLPEDAFLARMRRSSEDAIDGGTTGPPLPFLFGMQPLFGSVSGPEYNPRVDGLTVRAASIAQQRRALRVTGTESLNSPFALALFAVDFDAWQNLATEVNQVVDVDAAGTLTLAGTPIGAFVQRQGTTQAAFEVGQVTEPIASPLNDPVPPTLVVCPVTALVNSLPTVVGFGRVVISSDDPAVLQFTKQLAAVAPSFASTQAPAALLALSDPVLLTFHRQLTEPLLAPVLVR